MKSYDLQTDRTADWRTLFMDRARVYQADINSSTVIEYALGLAWLL